MTACVNKKHSRRVAAAVSASLVGALTLGAAPAVVMAAEAPVDEQTAEDAKAFDNGQVWAATVDGTSITKDDLYGDTMYSVNADGEAVPVAVTQLRTGNDKYIDLTNADTAADYKVSFVKANEKGEPTGEAVAEIVDPGYYCIKVEAIDGIYAGGAMYAPIQVKAVKFSSVAAFEVNPANDADLGDVDYVFTGSELNIGFKDGSTKLVEGEDYTVEWHLDGDSIDDEPVEVKGAGTYWAVIKGLGKYAGDTAYLEDVVVKTFGLGGGAVTITVDPVVGSNEVPEHPTSVTWTKGGRVTTLDPSLVDLKVSGVFGEPGAYNATISANEAAGDNVTGTKTFTDAVKKFAAEATIEYDGEALPATWHNNLSGDRNDFDVRKLAAYDAEGEKMTGVDVTVTDASGATVATYKDGAAQGTPSNASWFKTAGTYTVRVVAEAADFTAGGTATCTVKVVKGSVDADASAYVNFDGEAVTAVDTVWDGSGLTIGTADTNDVQVVVKREDGNRLTVGADCVVKVIDAEGNEQLIDSAGDVVALKDAGSYTIEIVGVAYDVTGTTTVPVTVAKKSYAGVELTGLATTGFQAEGANYKYLAWDEEGVATKTLSFTYLEGETPTTLPNGFTFTVTDASGKEVQKLTDEGVYTVHFAPVSDEVAKNQEAPADYSFVYQKADHALFTDVRYADYFADAVAWVSDGSRNYMNGYNDLDVFGSLDNLTRGQVACVLYNMAKGTGVTDDEGETSSDNGHVSFPDVAEGAYYAEAIAWAKSAGVVNGYADGTFHPDQAVSRQEFACMLANYAQKFDAAYEAASEDALYEMSDASSVAGFAKDSVAWAVENGIIGNSGYVAPNANIIRADAACMVYNYAK